MKTHPVVDNDPVDDVAVTEHVLLALAGDNDDDDDGDDDKDRQV